MAITTYPIYRSKVNSPHQIITEAKASVTTAVAGRPCSLWTAATNAGAVPTTAVVPTNTTAGAIPIANTTNPNRLLQILSVFPQGGTITICDRLSHQGGLSGTSILAQTTNLPTAALTRYTTGEGVMMAAEIYTAIGTTATTITTSYTNQAGTSGRTSVETVFGGTANREVARFIPLSLAAGDTGVRAVASATLAASTLTAGAFGITLYKPLLSFTVPGGPYSWTWDAVQNGCCNIPEIVSGSALFVVLSVNAAATGTLDHTYILAQD